MKVLVTGAAGYVGSELVDELLAAEHEVRGLDVLLHGQDDVAARLDSLGVDLQRGDVRDAEAREAGVERFVFASTCSNYGRMADPTVPIDETGELRPVSLYAEQKVAMEKSLLEGEHNGMSPTCLRFATVYGVGHRMRFDLTVNEFTRDLWAERKLDVFGETFWRPYVHVRDAARAVALVLATPVEKVKGRVFNAGHSDENYRKLDLVEIITGQLGRGDVEYVTRTEDPRDYKVSFERIKDELGYEPVQRVPTGIEELVGALEEKRFGDPFSPRYSNIG